MWWKCTHCGLELTFKQICESGGHDCQEESEEPKANKYEPWKELGMTETEYFHCRYIESRQEVAKLRAALEVAKKNLLDCYCAELASPDSKCPRCEVEAALK